MRPTRQTSSLSSADQLVQSQQRGGDRCWAGLGAGAGQGRAQVPSQACEGTRALPPGACAPHLRGLSLWKPGGGGGGGLEPAALVWISNSMLFSQKPLGQTFQVGKVEGKAVWPPSGEALAGRQRGGGGDPGSPPGSGPLLQGACGPSRWVQLFLTPGAAACSCLPTGCVRRHFWKKGWKTTDLTQLAGLWRWGN